MLPRSDESELRSPDELATLYELEPEVRDIIVEGRSDKAFFDWFLSEVETAGLVRAYAISDRVYVPDGDLISRGLNVGHRNRVLHLSDLFSALRVDHHSARLVIDADLSSVGLDPCSENGHLLLTDYSSIEAYALNERTLNKLLRVGLGAPEGLTGTTLLEAIKSGLVALFLIRACLRESGTGAPMPAKAPETAYRNAKMTDEVLVELFRLSLDKVPKDKRGPEAKDALLKQYRELEGGISGDFRHFANGHDISELIIQFLKDRCKSVFNNEGRRAFQAAPVLEILLMGSLELRDVEGYPMFSALRDWLGDRSWQPNAEAAS